MGTTTGSGVLSGGKWNRIVFSFLSDEAARVIQKKFLDWFYKPICKDGTYGLNCYWLKGCVNKQRKLSQNDCSI
jgi:hypothetical protein